jgi:hypothetical protein
MVGYKTATFAKATDSEKRAYKNAQLPHRLEAVV